jgi:hypothetical protein
LVTGEDGEEKEAIVKKTLQHLILAAHRIDTYRSISIGRCIVVLDLGFREHGMA